MIKRKVRIGSIRSLPGDISASPIIPMLTIRAWGQEVGADGTIEGPAPLVVFFDAAETTHTDPNIHGFHQLAYYHEFGYATPSTPGTWTFSGKPKGIEKGRRPMASHVYETPGTYTYKLKIEDANGNVKQLEATIVVQDPDVVFSGANTVLVSTDGSGDAAYPSATLYNYTVSGGFSCSNDKRYLFKAGQTFKTASVSVPRAAKRIHWSQYGSGAVPEILANIISTPHRDVETVAYGVMFYDVSLDELKVGFGNDIHFFRCGTYIGGSNGAGFGNTVKYYYTNPGTGQSPVNSKWPINVGIIDCTYSGGGTSYTYYGHAKYLSLVGNDPSNTVEHIYRLPLTYKGVIYHNNLNPPASNNRSQIKQHSMGDQPWSETLSSSDPNTMSQFIVIADNYVVAASNAWQVNPCPQNDTSNEWVEDVIIDMMEFQAGGGGSGSQSAIQMGGTRMTVSNLTVGARTATDHMGFAAHSAALTPGRLGPYFVPPGTPEIDNVTIFEHAPDIDITAPV